MAPASRPQPVGQQLRSGYSERLVVLVRLEVALFAESAISVSHPHRP